MKLRIGHELIYDFPQPTPVILVVNVRGSARACQDRTLRHLAALQAASGGVAQRRSGAKRS